MDGMEGRGDLASRAYRADPSQGLVDHRRGGNRAKLSKLQIEELQQKLPQVTPEELFGANAGTMDGILTPEFQG